MPGAALIKQLFRIGLILPVGRFWSLLPFRGKPQYMVIGKPIKVTAVKKPSMEQVNELLDQYKAAITKIFEDNKNELGYASHKIRIT